MTNDEEPLDPDLKRELARGPHGARLVWWVLTELSLSDSKSDAKWARALWQTHWRARAWTTIRAFAGAGGNKADDLVTFVKTWTGDTTQPGRILRMNATQWTPLERQLVAAWAARTFQQRHLAIAHNRGLDGQNLEEAVQGFWGSVHYEGEGGPLRRYLYEPAKPLSPEDQFRVYLDKCMANHCMRTIGNGIRRPRPISLDDPAAPVPVPAPAGRPLAITREDVDQCAETLTPMERLVLELHMQGYTPAEIARKLGTAPGAVRVRLFRARQKLRACLGLQAQPTSATADAREK